MRATLHYTVRLRLTAIESLLLKLHQNDPADMPSDEVLADRTGLGHTAFLANVRKQLASDKAIEHVGQGYQTTSLGRQTLQLGGSKVIRKQAVERDNWPSKHKAGRLNPQQVRGILDEFNIKEVAEILEGELVLDSVLVAFEATSANPDTQSRQLIQHVEDAADPWDRVTENYARGAVIDGVVRNMANYGAFIELEPGVEALMHVSDLSWTKKVAHPKEVLTKGDSIKCVILEVDREKRRISLGLKQLQEDPWVTSIPAAYQLGMIITGKVTKIVHFGAFITLEEGIEGLLHISEITDQRIQYPSEVVQIGQQLEVKIIRVDLVERKIALSLRQAKLWGL